MFWTLSTLSTEVWGAGGIATDEQFKAIAEQENLISKKEQDALAAQDNQASASAGSAVLGAEESGLLN